MLIVTPGSTPSSSPASPGHLRAGAALARTLVTCGAALLLVAMAFVAFGPPRVALADGTPDLTLAVEAPPEVLYGDTARVEATAANATATWGYNLSFREVLPPGVSYVPGSAAPAGVGDPEVLAGQPAPGSTTLLWVNVADLAPANSFTLSYEVAHLTSTDPAADCAGATLCVGETYSHAVGAYVNTDPRFVPDFDPTTGAPITGSGSHTGWAQAAASSLLVPFEVEKDEPNAEGEILRGLHDHATTYTVTVTNNRVNATDGLVVDDWIPAGLELLGCGGADNTTDAPTNPGSPLEYDGAAPLTATAAPADCVVPALVETVETDPDGAGPLPEAVYTHVRWTGLGDLAPDGVLVLRYAVGIPIRENTLAWSGAEPGTTGQQVANLDNNSGPETTDEQALTNHAAGTGTYQGAVSGGGSATSTVTDDLTRSAEDLSIHKTVSDETIDQSEVVFWDLLVETSEYRRLDEIVVTDTLPDGLCPLAPGTDFDTTEPVGRDECNADVLAGTPGPSIPYSTTAPPVEHADGTWTVTFDGSTAPQLAQMAASGAFTITMPTQARQSYQADGEDTTPVVGRDAWSNEVELGGAASPICGNGDDLCTEGEAPIDADRPDGEPIVDASGAEQEAEYSEIAKAIGAPDEDGDCDADVDWLENGPDEEPPLSFALGDRICYRLTVGFSANLHTRNATVGDFLPPNTTYVGGSAVALPGSTVDIVSGDPTLDDQLLTWRLGEDAEGGPCDPEAEDCYVQPGERFDVAIAVTADDDPSAGNAFDLVENLMKFSAANTDGTVVPLREDVDYVVAAPILGIDKANDAATPRREGDDVAYTVTVTNDGNEPALDVEVWDVLPIEVGCADVSAISAGGSCTATAGRDRVGWTLAGPIAGGGGTAAVTYTVTMPDGSTAAPAVAAGDTLTNDTGVRQYETETNRGDRVTYVPSSNVDAAQEPSANVDPVEDASTVDIVDATVTKAATTLTTQGGNSAASQATIGETVRYTVTLTVPAGTSAYDAVLADVPSTRTTYVDGSARVTLPTGEVFADDGSGDPLPAGYTWTDPARLALPATYHNLLGSGDDVFTLVFAVTVDAEAANTRTSGPIPNTATFTNEDGLGAPVLPVTSSSTSTQVVEPVVSVSKASSGGPIAGGDTVHYTVTVTNSSAVRVSTANDLVVTDTLPPGLTTTAPTGVTGGGTYDGGPPQVITWTVASLAPGASATLEYDVLVDDAVVAGQTYTNDVTVTSTSMPTADPQGPERTYTATDSSALGVVDPPFTKSVTPDTRTIGEVATYTIDLTIPANVELFDVSVIDTLDDGLELIDHATCADAGAGLCAGLTELGPDADTPTVGRTRAGWFLGDIGTAPSPRTVTLTYTALVADVYAAGPDVVAGDELDNAAALHWNATDELTTTPTEVPDPSAFDHTNPDEPAVATVTVVEPDVSIDKDVSGQAGDTDARTADVDEVLTYTVVVSNAAGDLVSPAHDLVVVDHVPAGLVLDTTSISGAWTWDATARTITWLVAGPLAPGASLPPFTYEAAVGDSAAMGAGTALVNTASVTEWWGVPLAERLAHGDRTYREGGAVDDVVTVTPAFPELQVVKSSSGTAVVGVPFAWTLTVDNTSTVADALDVDLVDTLPAGWTYQAGTATLSVDGGPVATLGDPAVAGPELTWTDVADLPPGAGLVVTFQATPTMAAGDNPTNVNTVDVTGDDADGNPGNDDGPYTDSDDDAVDLTGAALGNRVWEDLDGDGGQDGGEPGIDGVEVTLYAADGTTVIATTTTAGGGLYLFDLLPPGGYVVGFATPAGLVPTSVDAGGTTDATDSDASTTTGRTGVVVLAAGTPDLTVDAGFYELADLGDRVWEDLDGDGGQDGGEPGIDGVEVTLYAADGTTVIATTTTAGGGAYLFEDLAPGSYVVGFAAPSATLLSTPDLGGDDGADSDPDPATGRTAVIALVSGEDDLTVDAGVYAVGALGDRVWYDLDGDGVQDAGEPGAPGVTVELLSGTGTVLDTTTTGPTGDYLFTGLAPGTYAVRVTAPAGTALTTADAGADDTADSDADATSGETPPTSLVSGEEDRSLDAGLVGTGSLGDRVWEDLDADGVQDPGEPGIEGATVGLTWAGPDGTFGTGDDADLGTRATGPDGAYLFEGLPPGDHRAAVSAVPGGLVPTYDLDGVGSAGVATATLAAGEHRTDVDFGYQQQADLVLDKAVDDELLDATETATFRIDVGNDGPDEADGPIVVTDTLPAGLTPETAAGTGWTCGIAAQVVTCEAAGPLANGASLPELVVTATVSATADPVLVNTATVTTPTHDVNVGNDTDTAEVTVRHVADLVIDKSHAASAFVVGEQGTYTIGVTNQGPSPSVGTDDVPITVTDTLPAGLSPVDVTAPGWSCTTVGQVVTCELVGTIASGSSPSPISITVDVAPAAEGGVTNTATVTAGDTFDPEPGNDTDDDPTAITPSADLSLVKTSGGSFVVGAQGTFTFTVGNDGPSSAAAPVTVTDTLPAGLTYASSSSTDAWTCAAVGPVVTCTLGEAFAAGRTSAVTITVDVDATVGPDVVNSARVASPTYDPDPADNTSGTDDPSTPTVDLVVDKHHTGDLLVGTTGTYLLDVANDGPSVSEGVVTVSDTLPAGLVPTAAGGTGWACAIVGQVVTCTIDEVVGVGGSLPVISVEVDVLPAAYPSVVNTATVAPPPGVNEVVVVNNTDDDPTTVLPLADLELTKAHDGTFAVGQPGTYLLTVTNHGPTPTPGPLTVTDSLPVGLTFASGTGEGWTCSAVGQEVTCTYVGPDLAVDATTTVAVTVAVGTAAEGEVTNTATVDGPAADPDDVNDTDEDPTTVDPVADLAVDKSHEGDLVVGEPGQWRIDVANSGPSTARGPIVVTDTVPDHVEVTGATGDGWACDVAGQLVTCTRADDLPVGPAPALTLDVVARPGSEGEVVNTAAVDGPTTDPVPENDQDDDPTSVVAAVDLSLAKELVDDELVAGGTATWRLTVANAGPSAAAEVEVVDTLPDGLTYAGHSGAGWTCTAAGQAVTCRLAGTLAAGARSVVDIRTTVGASAGTDLVNRAEVHSSGAEQGGADNDVATSPEAVVAAPAAPGPGTPGRPGGDSLPRTGGDPGLLLRLGLALVGVGVVALTATRRRRRLADPM